MESYKILNNEIKIISIQTENGIEEREIILSFIQRQSDLAIIPCNEINHDYLKYLEDVANGAEVLPFDYQAEEIRQQEAQAQIQKEARIQEIKNELNILDIKAVRPILDNETVKIEEIKNQKLILRTELQSLQGE